MPTPRPALAPLLVPGILLLMLAGVYYLDFHHLRGGVPPMHSHAKARIADEVNLRFQQGAAMLHLKQYDHALTAFHRVLELNPTLPEAHANMGFALLGQEKFKEARDFFNSALALRESQLNAYYGSALAAYAMGERQDAMHALYHYVTLSDPADPYRAKAEDLLDTWRKAAEAEKQAAAKSKKRPSGKPSEKSALAERR
jgi:tetratricopeptide (TPR) repeat protein